jgi:hypothetical protein
LREQYQPAGNPVFSIDTKKKEHLGLLYRDGRVYCQEAFAAFDPDFPSWATGGLIPQDIWAPVRNHGHLTLGLSHDTSALACDRFRWFWPRSGRWHSPEATSSLGLCEAGGSNSSRQHLFKQDRQRWVNALGVEIRVAHSPSSCSKVNPLERRFFPHLTRACAGVLFDTVETGGNLRRKTRTKTGLTVTVPVLKRNYQTGRKVAQTFKDTRKIVLASLLPQWNYRAVPQLYLR